MARPPKTFDPRDLVSLGPCMKKLTVMQRKFVDAILMQPEIDYTKAAAAAGYGGERTTLSVTGTRLAHDCRIQEAMAEETTRRINAGAVMAASVMLQVAANPGEQTKDRLKAIQMILDRSGHSAVSVSKTTVEHVTDEREVIARIKQLATTLGVDAKKLLGEGPVIEGELIEAGPSGEGDGTDGLEDLL